MERIVLGCGGDLDATVTIPWLRDKYHADVIAVTVDLGQGGGLEAVRDRALAAGAARAHVLDAREEFAFAYVLPALAADAFGDRYAPLNDSLGRALVVSKLVEVAGIEQARAIAHGCHVEGSARFDGLAAGLSPGLSVIAPSRDIPVSAASTSRYCANVNLWGRWVSSGILDDLWAEAPEDAFSLTRPAADCPDEAANVELLFERGVPTAINGVEMPIVDLIASLTTIAGAHGVGRVDSTETSPAGLERVVHEAPAAVILHQAHADLQRLVSTADADRMSRAVSQEYRDVIVGGRWFTPLRESLDAYVQKTQERVTGTVRLTLFKGGCSIAGRQSPHALDTAAVPVGSGAGNVRAFRSPVVTR